MDPFVYSHQNRGTIVWMSQNTNTIFTTPAISEAILAAVQEQEYNLYPYSKGIFGLPEAIKEDLGVSDYDILLTNGGIEGLYILNRALLSRGNEVITTDPSFMPIHHQVTLSKAKTVELPVYSKPWKMTVDQINEAVTEKTKMILLIDPLNPLGTGYSRDEVRAISEIASDKDLFLVDDITYRDFADEHHLTSEFYPEKSILVYTFSKNCGLAGMRIGAFLAEPELMKSLVHYNTNVLSVNVLAQRGALAALRTKKEWISTMVEVCRRNQAAIKKAVEKCPGAFLPVYPSMTNMFVIDIGNTGADPESIQEKLLFEHNVFLRAGNYVSKRFGKRFVRVSFSVPEEQCSKFVHAFPRVMAELSR
ncbi:MAG: pyridoxal phosphate-dependent aminotransferase [Thermoplasmata archaeon]